MYKVLLVGARCAGALCSMSYNTILHTSWKSILRRRQLLNRSVSAVAPVPLKIDLLARALIIVSTVGYIDVRRVYKLLQSCHYIHDTLLSATDLWLGVTQYARTQVCWTVSPYTSTFTFQSRSQEYYMARQACAFAALKRQCGVDAIAIKMRRHPVRTIATHAESTEPVQRNNHDHPDHPELQGRNPIAAPTDTGSITIMSGFKELSFEQQQLSKIANSVKGELRPLPREAPAAAHLSGSSRLQFEDDTTEGSRILRLKMVERIVSEVQYITLVEDKYRASLRDVPRQAPILTVVTEIEDILPHHSFSLNSETAGMYEEWIGILRDMFKTVSFDDRNCTFNDALGDYTASKRDWTDWTHSSHETNICKKFYWLHTRSKEDYCLGCLCFDENEDTCFVCIISGHRIDALARTLELFPLVRLYSEAEAGVGRYHPRWRSSRNIERM